MMLAASISQPIFRKLYQKTLNSLKLCNSSLLLGLNTNISASAATVQALSTSGTSDEFYWRDDKEITNSSVFIQDGLRIDELPCIVRIINGEFAVFEGGRTSSGAKIHGISIKALPTFIDKKHISVVEEKGMVDGFNRCSSLMELFSLLSYCPEEEVTPNVALTVIKNLIHLENNKKFCNPSNTYLQEEEEHGDTLQLDDTQTLGSNKITENFTRSAVVAKLVDRICQNSDVDVVLEAVKVMRKDTSEADRTIYLRQLCDECLVLVSEGKLSVTQIISLAQDMYLLKTNFTKSYIDKLWIGLDGVENLDEYQLCKLFAILPYISQSRQYVFHIAERRALAIWYKFKADHIIQIVSVLVTCHCNSYKLQNAISKWTNVNIHTLTEGNLRWILLAFTKLQFINSNLTKALIRYTKAKQHQITDPGLVAVIMDYCSIMRFRSPEVLEVCSQFFINNYESLSIPDIWSICRPFGQLNYVPTDNYKFFKAFEQMLENNFVAFSPDIFVDLLLTCVYLERYPLNFMHKVFHPFFFQRLEYLSMKDNKKTLNKLKILDKALRLEAPCYEGPMMMKIPNMPIDWNYRDIRITKIIGKLCMICEMIAGDPNRVHPSVPLSGFPKSSLYNVDCLIDMTIKSGTVSNMGLNCQDRIAVIIEVPEHYDMDRTALQGVQAMRLRHLALAGLKVVCLDYEVLVKQNNLNSAKAYVFHQIINVVNKKH